MAAATSSDRRQLAAAIQRPPEAAAIGDISKWDVSSDTTMFTMFAGATSFNSELSKWDVSEVTSMTSMFAKAASFNSDLSKWDV
jgi:surface protein